MDTKLIAKISVKHTDGKTRTGTGFPIGKDIVLTARHVVDFETRDKTKPIKIEWPTLHPPKTELLDTIEFRFNGGEEYDVVVFSCPIPDVLKIPSCIDLFENQRIDSRKGWASVGYPKVNNHDQKGVTGRFGVDLESLKIDLTLDDTVRKNIQIGWAGMSGAPVFSVDSKKINAVITNETQWMERQLIGTTIRELLKISQFRDALGLNDTDEKYQNYINALPGRIKDQLKRMEGGPLYCTLAGKYNPTHSVSSVDQLLQQLHSKINDDYLSFLEDYRVLVEPILIKDKGQVNDAETLFFLFLGFYAKPNLITVVDQVFEFAVRTRLSVEIYLAAYYGLAPDLVQELTEGIENNQFIKGRSAIDSGFLTEVGWNPDKNSEMIAKVVNTAVNKIYDQVIGIKPTNDLDDFNKEELNDRIKTRLKDVNPELFRLEVASTADLRSTHPLHNKDVCTHLKKELPDLIITRYGLGIAEFEAKLSALVQEFFRMIQKYKNTL